MQLVEQFRPPPETTLSASVLTLLALSASVSKGKPGSCEGFVLMVPSGLLALR